MRFYNFKNVELVHIDVGPAKIEAIADATVTYTDDAGQKSSISLEQCARVYRCLKEAHAFPPGDEENWSVLIDMVSDFATLEIPAQAVVGLRGAVDDPPWFQFLDRQRTQFQFMSYENIQKAFLEPLTAAGNWYTWDAS